MDTWVVLLAALAAVAGGIAIGLLISRWSDNG